MGLPSDTRNRLIEAAVDVLADDGLAGFTHRRIEDRAGVSHGSTTYHFGSRDALYAAAIERVLEIEAQLSQDVVRELLGMQGVDLMLGHSLTWEIDWFSPDGLTLLRELTARSFQRFRASRRTTLARFEMYVNAARTPGGVEQLTAARQRVYAAQAAQAAQLGYPDPELYSRAMPALIDGLLVHDLSVPDAVIESRAADALLALFAGLFGSAGGGAGGGAGAGASTSAGAGTGAGATDPGDTR